MAESLESHSLPSFHILCISSKMYLSVVDDGCYCTLKSRNYQTLSKLIACMNDSLQFVILCYLKFVNSDDAVHCCVALKWIAVLDLLLIIGLLIIVLFVD